MYGTASKSSDASRRSLSESCGGRAEDDRAAFLAFRDCGLEVSAFRSSDSEAAPANAPKMTLSPSFHISVTRVSPGKRTPAKRTLMSEYGPNLRKMCLPEMPNEHKPCLRAYSCQLPERTVSTSKAPT